MLFVPWLQEYAAAVAGDGEGERPPRREAIYNAEVMHEKLEDIGWSEQAAWSETLALTSDAPSAIRSVDDDLERELGFYNQALASAQEAIRRMQAAGVAWARPADYYAEMVKSDGHMAKVKEQLLHEQQLVSEMEQRRKERDAKRYAKQVQGEKKKERDQERKKAITDVAKLRKQREKSVRGGEWTSWFLSFLRGGRERNPWLGLVGGMGSVGCCCGAGECGWIVWGRGCQEGCLAASSTVCADACLGVTRHTSPHPSRATPELLGGVGHGRGT